MKNVSVDEEIQGMIDEWKPNTDYPLSVIATTDKKGNVTFSIDHTEDEEEQSETPDQESQEGEPASATGAMMGGKKMPKAVAGYMNQMA